jgi:two-component system, NarL family, invasion response regulator UvrY
MNIKLTGSQSDRLEILAQLLEEKEEWNVSLAHVTEEANDSLKKRIGDADIIIADLSYVHGPAPDFIRQLKKQLPGAKLIGLHFYRNLKLITPLIHAGLDGYIHSNSHKSILIKAIEDVISGKQFILENDS